MRKKKALITGITGQDGLYITEYLLDKNLNTKAENFDHSEIKGFTNIRDFLSGDIIIKKILKILLTYALEDRLE
jgi:GDP-D-mannose dehydratase